MSKKSALPNKDPSTKPTCNKCLIQEILPDLIKKVVKQILESTTTSEGKVFLKEHRRTKNSFYVRTLDTIISLKIPKDKEGLEPS